MSHNFDDHLGGEKAPVPVKQAGKVKITISKKQNSLVVPETEQHIELPAQKVVQPIAIVKVTGSKTLNLGNYNSAKVEVGIEWPCHVGEVEDAFDFCYKWVDEKIEQILKSEGQA